jgi:hypothetical protein
VDAAEEEVMKPDDVNALRDRVRSLESDNADLRRDYAELCALDPDGLQAKVVASQDIAERYRLALASVQAENAVLDGEVRDAMVRVSSLEFVANPAVVAHDLANLREERDAFCVNLRAALADVERLAGASVAEVLLERRGEIRDLTGRLSDALALVDRMRAASHEKAIATVDFKNKRAVYERVVGIDAHDRVLVAREAMEKACVCFAGANSAYFDLMLVTP